MYNFETEGTAFLASWTPDDIGHCVGSFGTITVKLYHQTNSGTFEQRGT